MTEFKEITKTILSSYPDWIINSISFLGEGDFYSAFLINQDWVFRFAKHDEARQSLKREYCLLPKILAQITLQIPDPQIASFESEPAFMAYRLLPDNSLSPEIYLSLNEAERTNCASQVAGFLNQFHSLETKLAQACGVKICDYRSQYSNLLVEAEELLFPILEKPDCHFIEQIIGEYLTANRPFRPALLHGDLSPDHVLFDENRTLVSGIIDFGDMMIGDPVWDLLWIYEDYGLDFLSRVLPVLDEIDKTAFLQRLFQFSMLELIEWAVRGKKNNDQELEETLREIQRMRKEKNQRFDELMSVCKIG